MLKELIEKSFYCFLVKFYPDYYEFKSIKRVSSSESFIEYSSDED